MSKFAIALAAAALLAAPSFSSTAEAGVRLGFGFPLGSFVARPHQSYSSGPSYRAQQHCAKKAARQARIAAARQEAARKAQAQKIAAAEKSAQAKRAKAAAVQTAKVEAKPVVTTAAAPTVHVPDTAATAADTTVNTAAATTTEPAKTAALEPVAAKETVTEAKVEKTVTEKPSVKVSSTTGKRICRRFSAATAGLIDVPCE